MGVEPCAHGYQHAERRCPLGCYLVDELEHLTAGVLAFDQSKLGNSVDRAHFVAVYIHLGKLRALLEVATGLRP